MNKFLHIGVLAASLTISSYALAQEKTYDYSAWGEGSIAGRELNDESFLINEQKIRDNLTNVVTKDGTSSAAWNYYALRDWRQDRYERHKDWLLENMIKETHLCEYAGRNGVDNFGLPTGSFSEERYQDLKAKIDECVTSDVDSSYNAGVNWPTSHFSSIARKAAFKLSSGRYGSSKAYSVGLEWGDENFKLASDILVKTVSKNQRFKANAKRSWKKERAELIK